MRLPEVAPDWMKPLLEPEPPSPYPFLNLPLHRRYCLELYSGGLAYGGARLSVALSEQGLLVLRPVEAYPCKGKYVHMCDLQRVEARHRILNLVASNAVSYIHVGIPCSSWGRLNNLNHGTRSKQFPDGTDGRLPRESLGNEQASFICELLLLLLCSLCKIPWNVENPSDSLLWSSSPFVVLCSDAET